MPADTTQLCRFEGPVILVGAGVVHWDSFAYAADLGYPVVAVDGGADTLRGRGIHPDVIIGDMDSVSDTRGWPARTRIVAIPEQDTTDFEKALYATSAPLYLAFGFMGRRLDHSLAALHCLVKYRRRRSVVLIDEVDLAFAPAAPLVLDLPVDSRFSVNPLGPVTFARSSGLRYPLDGLTLQVGVAISCANTVTGSPVSVVPEAADGADYVVVVPNRALASVIAWYQSR